MIFIILILLFIFINKVLKKFFLHTLRSIANISLSRFLKFIKALTCRCKSTSFIVKYFSFSTREQSFNICQISRNNISQCFRVLTSPIYSSLIIIAEIHLRIKMRGNVKETSNGTQNTIIFRCFMNLSSDLHHTISKDIDSSIQSFTSRTILNLRCKSHSNCQCNRRMHTSTQQSLQHLRIHNSSKGIHSRIFHCFILSMFDPITQIRQISTHNCFPRSLFNSTTFTSGNRSKSICQQFSDSLQITSLLSQLRCSCLIKTSRILNVPIERLYQILMKIKNRSIDNRQGIIQHSSESIIICHHCSSILDISSTDLTSNSLTSNKLVIRNLISKTMDSSSNCIQIIICFRRRFCRAISIVRIQIEIIIHIKIKGSHSPRFCQFVHGFCFTFRIVEFTRFQIAKNIFLNLPKLISIFRSDRVFQLLTNSSFIILRCIVHILCSRSIISNIASKCRINTLGSLNSNILSRLYYIFGICNRASFIIVFIFRLSHLDYLLTYKSIILKLSLYKRSGEDLKWPSPES